MPPEDTATLLRWFWRSTFAHRYSGNPGRNIRHDVEQAAALRKKQPSTLDQIAATVDASFFLENTFNSRTVATKAMILLLANNRPCTFLSGQAVDLDAVLSEPNRKEYHHCMPRAWMRDYRAGIQEQAVNSLANFAIITRAENREIRAKAPSEYRGLMATDIGEIERGAYLPPSLWDDDEAKFFAERAELLVAAVQARLA
ncbi:hypothetical protein [Isoptericola sp. QY 916]|uniref:hypothetical protein n=1 Tax=Isoptericola sp. QY 916 TaxID=2782570 RepID=UPI003D2FF6C3|nr:hypothetical protein [Isoptericola sp. QY 916]